jgi:hypothetical protein
VNVTQAQVAELGYEIGARVEGTYSARMTLGERVPVPEIVRRIGAIVRAQGIKGENWPVSGFIAASPSETADSVLFACDPNRRGNPSPAESRIFVPKVVEAYWQQYGDADLVPEDITDDFRALPGLVRGYYDYKNPDNPNNKIVSMEEALNKLPQTASGLSVVEGTVWSARDWGADSDPFYFEPGLKMQGPEHNIYPVLQMANAIDQDRSVAEITTVETQVIQRPRPA